MAPVICIASAYATTRVSYQSHTNCDEWRQMVISTAKRTHLTRSCVAVPQGAVVSSKEFSTQNLNGRARLPRLTFTASRSSAYCAFPGSSVHTQVAGQLSRLQRSDKNLPKDFGGRAGRKRARRGPP